MHHPLQPYPELENQQIPSFVPHRPDHILNDLPILISDLAPNFAVMGKQEMIITQENNAIMSSKDGDAAADTKRILHRDVERQRRQEMSNLYASLRSLLPLEYIKGKRAISDHMQEAVNYIKSLEKNINQLRARRDGLIKVSSSSRSSGSSFSLPACTNIAVNRCSDGGVEILIGSSPKDEVFPLSRVLKMLLGEGLNVVSCISTAVGNMRVQTIRAEVLNDQPSIDVLRGKLTDMVDPGNSNSG